MFCNTTVFPVLGGETINDLCPFPMGAIKSISLVVTSAFFSTLVVSISNFNLS